MAKEVVPLPLPSPSPLPPSTISSEQYGVTSYGASSGLEYPESKRLWFNNQDVYLDGWKFISCRFDNCRLFVKTGHFIIDRCYIDETNTVYFGDDSVKIIQFYNRYNDAERESSPFFVAVKNSDGTLSVGN